LISLKRLSISFNQRAIQFTRQAYRKTETYIFIIYIIYIIYTFV